MRKIGNFMEKKKSSNKRIKMGALTLALSFSLAACQGSEEKKTEPTALMESETKVKEADGGQTSGESKTAEPEKNRVFGEFTSMTLDGEEINQEVFANAELTMVNLWGTFCGYCIEEMPDLGELNREYKDQGFQIIGMLTDVTDPNQEDAVKIVETTKADYPHILMSEELYPYVAGVPVPTTVFLDKNGNPVGEVYAGAKNKALWEEIIKDALKEVKK